MIPIAPPRRGGGRAAGPAPLRPASGARAVLGLVVAAAASAASAASIGCSGGGDAPAASAAAPEDAGAELARLLGRVEGHPRDPEVHRALAEALDARGRAGEAGRHREAAAFWVRLAAEEGVGAADGGAARTAEALHAGGREKVERAAVRLGYETYDRDLLRAGLEDLERAVELRPGDAAYQYDAGYAWFLAQEFERALARFERAVALDPDHAAAHQGIGAVLLNGGAVEPALAALGRAVALAPDDPNARYVHGKCLEQAGELEAALEAYRRTVALHPGLVEPYFRAANVFVRLGARDAAERWMDEFQWWQALRRDLRIEEALAGAGQGDAEPRDAPELERLEERLAARLDERPRDARVAVALARVLAARGRAEEARETMRAAVEIGSKEPGLFCDLARLAPAVGLDGLVRPLYVKALQLDPTCVEARLGLGDWLWERGRAAATEHYRVALGAAPGLASVERRLAELEARDG